MSDATHPLIEHNPVHGAARIASSRLYVFQVIDALVKCDGDVAVVADDFGLTPAQVAAADAYHRAHPERVAQDAGQEREVFFREMTARWRELRADPAAWAEIEAERDLEANALRDGIDD